MHIYFQVDILTYPGIGYCPGLTLTQPDEEPGAADEPSQGDLAHPAMDEDEAHLEIRY